jgi:hypothetical protein
MRTINLQNNVFVFYSSREQDIPVQEPNDNVTVWVKRSDDLDALLNQDVINLCETLEALKTQCEADKELHIEEADDGIIFIHAVDESGEVNTVDPVPAECADMFNTMSDNMYHIFLALEQYQYNLNVLAGAITPDP